METKLTFPQSTSLAAMDRDESQSEEPAGAPSMLEVLWHQRWIFAASIALCLLGTAIYLMLATRIYHSVAEVYIGQNGPKVINENQGGMALPSESYLYAQASAMQSASVLQRALDAVNYRDMQTFAHVLGNPVAWLRADNGFDVEPVKKSDTLLVSMESPYPYEAARIVNAVIDSYITERSLEEQTVGKKMLDILRKQHQDVELQRETTQLAMLKLKQEYAAPSLREDKNNDVLERVSSLSNDLNTARMEIITLEAHQKSAEDVLKSPASISAFAQAQQSKNQDPGDQEYRDLRSLLSRTSLSIPTESSELGDNNPRIRTLRIYQAKLQDQVAKKELSIAQGNLAEITHQLADAKEKVAQLNAALEIARQQAVNRSPASARFASMEVEVTRLDQMSNLLVQRIGEVSANIVDAGALNVRIVDPARPPERPSKPRKSLALAAALLAGLLLGTGLSLAQEWRSARLSSPAEVQTLLRTPVIAMVPRINPRLSPAMRGQLVHMDARSPVAEAYRSIRTLLQLGAAHTARTILLASPTSGDGKSTTASNLAIAFAQTGCRTLLIDCDLREPVQHMIFGLSGDCGLSSLVSGEEKIEDAVHRTHIPGLYVLPCGPVPANPSELLASEQFKQLLHELGKAFDRIIIDSPPLCSVTDARILAATCDATLLVLRMNKSTRAFGLEAMAGLDMVGARVVGAIANGVSYGTQPYGHAYRSWQYAPSAASQAALPAPGKRPGDNGVTHADVIETSLT